jgi:hypothetical protein
MNTGRDCFAAVVLTAAVHCAWAEQWFRVGGPEMEAATPTIVEIDLDTLQTRGPGTDAVIRVSHPEPKTHNQGFGYRSFVATVQFDCRRQLVTLGSAAYFSEAAAQGSRVGADSTGKEGGMPPRLLESVPVAAWRALLRASCSTGAGT